MTKDDRHPNAEVEASRVRQHCGTLCDDTLRAIAVKAERQDYRDEAAAELKRRAA